jgi:hypothetical protein
MQQHAVASICRALLLAFFLVDAVNAAATTRNRAALVHKQPRAGLGGDGDNNTTAVGGGRSRGHARAGNINVYTGDRYDDANQALSGEAQVSNIDKVPGFASTPANVLRSSCSAYTDSSCPQGARVKRGPDWQWGDQDGGDGQLGTVQEWDDQWCKVTWDNGYKNSYRVGSDGAYDLCRAAGSVGCDKYAFEICAVLGNENYINDCCQDECAWGYRDCYFCPASGTGGRQCFNLAESTETACLASSNCPAAAASPSPPPPSSPRNAVPVGLLCHFLPLFLASFDTLRAWQNTLRKLSAPRLISICHPRRHEP